MEDFITIFPKNVWGEVKISRNDRIQILNDRRSVQQHVWMIRVNRDKYYEINMIDYSEIKDFLAFRNRSKKV